MGIRRVYFTNTSPGHNKDYLIEWDFETNTITSTYGPIDGRKAVRVNRHSSTVSARTTFDDKCYRRHAHGYAMQYDTIEHDEPVVVITPPPPVETMQAGEFLADLREMQAVQRGR